ncbi:MAG: hypothetical protein AAF790_15195 [Planctomycetota bacterium]
MPAAMIYAAVTMPAAEPPIASLAAPAMFALGCGLITAILLRRSYRYFGRRRPLRDQPAIDAQPRPTGAWSGAHTDAAARIERQKVELHELGREITARIDSKLILLQDLSQRSDAQIERLETLLAEARALEPELQATRQ